MVAGDLPLVDAAPAASYRLVSSKFPPIALFDDVADAEDFAALYELQALTNPRLLMEAGDLGLIAREEIPFGITGCTYAVAPFTHVNPDGSRFSDGSFGVLYLADTLATAIAEIRHHQQRYLARVEGLRFDRLVFRALHCRFEQRVADATGLDIDDPVYEPDDYTASRELGGWLRRAGVAGLQYHSVRAPGAVCWGLLTPKGVRKMVQQSHYEFIWDGSTIASVNRVAAG